MEEVAMSEAVQRPRFAGLRGRLQGAAPAERLLRWSLGIVYFWFGGLKTDDPAG